MYCFVLLNFIIIRRIVLVYGPYMYIHAFTFAICWSQKRVLMFRHLLRDPVKCIFNEEEAKAGCFAIVVLQMYCYYKSNVALPHGAVGWSTVCDCGIS